MLDLLLTPKAEQDLSEIYEYTFETWGISQADKYQDELYQAMQAILINSHIGKTYPYSERQYRILQINRHLIFYRIEKNKCIVVTVLHDRVNIKTHL